MNKRIMLFIFLLVLTCFVNSEIGPGYLTKIESYSIGELTTTTYNCSVDVRVVQSSRGREFFIIITKPSGTSADDQVAAIPALDFIDFVKVIPELSRHPLPIADYFERRYTYDNFTFSYAPYGRYNELGYVMAVDTRIKNSTVVLYDTSDFLDVFKEAIEKVFELNSKSDQ